MDHATHPSSVLAMLYRWERETPDRILLRQATTKGWEEFPWSRCSQEIRSMAAFLHDVGCKKGDRIALLSKNCAHWILADLAIMLAGCVSVPLYPNQSPESLKATLEHSEAKFIFVGKLDEPEKLASGIPPYVPRIAFPYPHAMKATHTWTSICQRTEPSRLAPLPELTELATIIYTSGTSGEPKGVMHSYGSMASATQSYREAFEFSANDRLFSYLPLSHVAERIIVEMMGLYFNIPISFAESLDTFIFNLRSTAPTVFFSVPRLWTKFHLNILEKIPQSRLDKVLKLPIAGRFLKYKILKGLGLHRARLVGSGAAPIAPHLLEWYRSLGLCIIEGYGLTETFGVGTSNRPQKNHLGTVGTAMPGSRVSIVDQGEILIQSPSLMMGYYRDAESTQRVLSPKGFRTGDVGEMDANGSLRITGRTKDIFKTAKGKFIAPAPLEHKFLAHTPHIEQLCIMGHGRPSPVMICALTPAAKNLPRVELERSLNQTLAEFNLSLEKHERIQQCIIVEEEWTVDSGLLTPTLKIRRHALESRYQSTIEAAASFPQAVIWQQRQALAG